MLVVTLREGDYVMIGDNIKVHYNRPNGKDQLAIGIEAPKEVEIIRGKLYEERVAEKAAEGDKEAQILSKQLKKEYVERRRKANFRQARRDDQKRRSIAHASGDA